MERPRKTFCYDNDPRGLRILEENERYALMSEKEALPKFHSTQFGAFSTRLVDLSADNFFRVPIPKSQVGYWNLSERPRERQFPFEEQLNSDWDPDGPPLVRRRSVNLYSIRLNAVLTTAESSMDRGYEYLSRQSIVQRDKLFGKSLTDPSLSNSDLVEMLLLPIELEKARMTYLLRSARRHFSVTRTGRATFVADAVTPMDRNALKFLGATVGERVVLSMQGRKEELFVSKLTTTGLLLTYPNRRDFTRNADGESGPPQGSFLHDARGLFCLGDFHMAPFTYKIMETSVIDGLTAFGPAWFGDREVKMTGLPVVPMEWVEKVSKREGLQNPHLSDEQLSVLVLLLRNEVERGIMFCLGAAGTGKTKVLDEYIFQLTLHHQEDCPGSALIYLAEPTNNAVNRAAERLVRQGYPLQRMLVLRAEHAFHSTAPPSGVRSERIQDYRADDNVQLIIATVQVLSRIPLHRVRCECVMLKPPAAVVFDEVCSYSVVEALGPITLAGPPGTIVAAGDVNQIEPRWTSKTAEMMKGNKTLVDLAQRKPGSFTEGCSYPTPTSHYGAVLTQNHRATTFLIGLVAPLYGGNVVPSASTNDHDVAAAELMHSLRDVRYIGGGYTFLWLNTDQACYKHHLTDSWFNPLEARITARVTDAIAKVTGDSQIMLITGYSKQVYELRSYFAEDREIPIGTVDEFQGMDSNIVVASLVRSTKGDGEHHRRLGFLASPKRANTLLTRARHLVVLVGSAKHFRESTSEYWQYLLGKASVREVFI